MDLFPAHHAGPELAGGRALRLRHERRFLSEHLALAPAEDPFRGLVPHLDLALDVRDHDGQGRGTEQGAQAVVGFTQRLLGPAALTDLPGQFPGTLVDQAVQVCQAPLGLPGQKPFPGEGMRQLEDLDPVEGLLQNDQALRVTQALNGVLPRVVRMGGANHDLKVGIGFPELGDGLDAVPSGRHADIHQSQRIAPAFRESLLEQRQPVLTLIGGIQNETGAATPWRRAAEQGGGGLVERRRFDLGESFPKVLMDRGRVVDDQNARMGRGVRLDAFPERLGSTGVFSERRHSDYWCVYWFSVESALRPGPGWEGGGSSH